MGKDVITRTEEGDVSLPPRVRILEEVGSLTVKDEDVMDAGNV